MFLAPELKISNCASSCCEEEKTCSSHRRYIHYRTPRCHLFVSFKLIKAWARWKIKYANIFCLNQTNLLHSLNAVYLFPSWKLNEIWLFLVLLSASLCIQVRRYTPLQNCNRSNRTKSLPNKSTSFLPYKPKVLRCHPGKIQEGKRKSVHLTERSNTEEEDHEHYPRNDTYLA